MKHQNTTWGENIVYISDRMSNTSESQFFRKFKTNPFYTESHEIMKNSKVRLVKHGHWLAHWSCRQLALTFGSVKSSRSHQLCPSIWQKVFLDLSGSRYFKVPLRLSLNPLHALSETFSFEYIFCLVWRLFASPILD